MQQATVTPAQAGAQSAMLARAAHVRLDTGLRRYDNKNGQP